MSPVAKDRSAFMVSACTVNRAPSTAKVTVPGVSVMEFA